MIKYSLAMGHIGEGSPADDFLLQGAVETLGFTITLRVIRSNMTHLYP